jgi:fructokinase
MQDSASSDDGVFFGVELGGTKVCCGVGRPDGTLVDRAQIPTRDPESTLSEVREAFAAFARRHGEPNAVGVAAFGPVRVDPRASDFGRIGATPKIAWRGFNVVDALRDTFDGPIALQTDVIGAAIGEARWGAGMGCDPFVYVTVGTGIGGGILANGSPITGLLHPEIGHIRPPRAPGDEYPGGCASHGDCLEGLAAGPSIVSRWGARLSELPDDHEAHDVVAHYLSHLALTLVLCVVPRRIVLGGGVMSSPGLLLRVRRGLRDLLAGYLAVAEIERDIDTYIVQPGLGADAGLLGAVALALDARGAGMA